MPVLNFLLGVIMLILAVMILFTDAHILARIMMAVIFGIAGLGFFGHAAGGDQQGGGH